MTNFMKRPYTAADDLQAMIDFLVAVRPAARITDYPGVVDLRELLALSAVQANTCLWFNEHGQMIGFAFVDSYNY